MPIDTTHPEYQESVPRVKQVRDTYQGSEAVKSAEREYLPQLTGQDDKEYKAMLMRGLFLPTVGPTVTAMKGAVMRKSPVVEFPLSIEYIETDTDGEGRDLNLFISKSLDELMQAGRVGALVEHDGDRCRVLMYQHEHIVNWSDDFIVLQQEYRVEDEKDPYAQEYATEYLELRLQDGIYIQNVWRLGEGKKWSIFETVVPSNRGEPLTYIPFVSVNAFELSFSPSKPPMLDISDINLDHYRLSTDLRHGLHFTALPTPFVFGDLEDDDGNQAIISMGSGRANIIPDVSARAELLEFSGAGLGSVSDTIAEDVVAMAGLGARMLATNTGGVKAAETARIEASGQTASLSTIANAVENFITRILEYCAAWEGGEGEVEVMINKDFIDASMTPQEITALLQAWTSGAISLETFLDNLKRGEILPKGVNIEDEIEKIDEEGGADLDLGDEEQIDPFAAIEDGE